MVFLHHANQDNHLHLPEFLYRYIMEFHTGVPVFFVLSGFLITYRYYDPSPISKSWLKEYIVNRIARIYPMFLILTILTFGVNYYINHTSTDLFVAWSNLFFIKGFFNDLKFTGITQGWSLTVEECFYFLAPFLFFIYTKRKKLFLMPVLFLAAGFILVKVFGGNGFYGFMGNIQFMLLYTFFGRCFEFLTGIYLAFYIKKLDLLNKMKRTGIRTTFWGIVSFCVVISMMAYAASYQNLKYSVAGYTGLFINNICLPVCVGILFTGLITEDSLIKRILQTPLLQILGKSSYIFYLIHIGFISSLLNTYNMFNNGYLNIVWSFVILNIISVILFKVMEEPLNFYIRKCFAFRRILKPVF